MTPTDFFEQIEKKPFTKLTSTGISDNLENVMEFAEQYHQAKLKLLGISGVSTTVNCEHENETLHQGNGFVYKTCTNCGEDI